MAAVNEAYRALNDPARRARYDAGLRQPAPVPPPRSAGPQGIEPDDDVEFVPAGRGTLLGLSLPWALVLGVLALIFVFTAFASTARGGKAPARSGLSVGTCVIAQGGNIAVERPCSGPHEGVVVAVAPAGIQCPLDTVTLLDPGSPQHVCVKGD